MRVLLDTNVLLDVLLQRSEWLEHAEKIWQASQAGQLETCISASSITDIFYISRRLAGLSRARQIIGECLANLTILSVDASILEQAHASGLPDFEDAVQIACAARHGLDAIITRDPSGFATSPIAAFSPADWSSRL